MYRWTERAGSVAKVLAIACVALVTLGASSAPFAAGQSGSFPRLEAEKTEAEIAQLRGEAEDLRASRGTIGDVVRLAPLITALVAVAALIATMWRQIGESGRQRNLDREERKKVRQERFDEQFRQIVENLSSKNGPVRAAAAASIQTFMRPEYRDFHQQVFLLLMGALRFPQKDFSDKLLVRTFQQVAREVLPDMRQQGAWGELDLSNCFLARVQLNGLDLSGVDIGFADLHGADLSGSKLWRAKGIAVNLGGSRLSGTDLGEARMINANLVKARFNDANLVSAKLKQADGTGASFRGSRMQEVQLDRAVLRGAHFERANLDSGYFRGASFDQGALKSIARGALNWRKAHWDPTVLAELERLSSEASP
jgi:uncharacterized protein YjbI with pentapeptide repeats